MTAQSLNAVKAALANLHLLRERGDLGDFACAAAGLRIDDLAAVVALCDDAFTLRQQRDELVEGTERLVDALTEETRRRQLAEVEVERLRDQTVELCIDHEELRDLVYEVICWNNKLQKRPMAEMMAALAETYQRTADPKRMEARAERATLRAEVERLKSELHDVTHRAVGDMERLKREAATVREVLNWAATHCPPVDAIAFIGNDEDRRLCRTLHSLVTSEPAPVEHGPACYSCGRPRDEPAPVEPKQFARCSDCAFEWSCFNGSTPCHKPPTVPATDLPCPICAKEPSISVARARHLIHRTYGYAIGDERRLAPMSLVEALLAEVTR